MRERNRDRNRKRQKDRQTETEKEKEKEGFNNLINYGIHAAAHLPGLRTVIIKYSYFGNLDLKYYAIFILCL